MATPTPPPRAELLDVGGPAVRGPVDPQAGAAAPLLVDAPHASTRTWAPLCGTRVPSMSTRRAAGSRSTRGSAWASSQSSPVGWHGNSSATPWAANHFAWNRAEQDPGSRVVHRADDLLEAPFGEGGEASPPPGTARPPRPRHPRSVPPRERSGRSRPVTLFSAATPRPTRRAASLTPGNDGRQVPHRAGSTARAPAPSACRSWPKRAQPSRSRAAPSARSPRSRQAGGSRRGTAGGGRGPRPAAARRSSPRSRPRGLVPGGAEVGGEIVDDLHHRCAPVRRCPKVPAPMSLPPSGRRPRRRGARNGRRVAA